MKLYVHKFLAITEVEGPGRRACIWVQGCSIRCPGCSVPWTWPERQGQQYSIEQLAAMIVGGDPVEGVTFLGGEPFDQARGIGRVSQDSASRKFVDHDLYRLCSRRSGTVRKCRLAGVAGRYRFVGRWPFLTITNGSIAAMDRFQKSALSFFDATLSPFTAAIASVQKRSGNTHRSPRATVHQRHGQQRHALWPGCRH